MNFLRKLLAGILISFFVPLLFVLVILTSVSAVLFHYENFNSVLKTNNSYHRIAALIPDTLRTIGDENVNNESLPPSVVEKLISTSFDQKVFALDLESVVGKIYPYATGEKDTLSAKLDLTKYTDKFQENLKPQLKDYLATLPLCKTAEEKKSALQADFLPKCTFPGLNADKILSSASFDQNTKDLFATLPKNIVITEKKINFHPPLNVEGSANTKIEGSQKDDSLTFEKVRAFINLEKSTEILLFILLVFIALALLVLDLKHIAGFLKILAVAIASSVFILLISSSLFLYFVKPNLIRSYINKQVVNSVKDNPSAQKLASIIVDNFLSFFYQLMQKIQFESIVLIVIAISLFLARFFFMRKELPKQHDLLTNKTP